MSLIREKPMYTSLKHGGPMYESRLKACGIPVELNPYRKARKSVFANHLRQAVVTALQNFSTILR